MGKVGMCSHDAERARSVVLMEALIAWRDLVAGLGELPPSCGWPASSSSLSNLSVIKTSVGEVDHDVPEYTPSAFRGGSVRFLCAGGLYRGTVLSMNGGSRLKGVNSLKSSEDLWGPVRWHSRLDPFPYSEPLTNLVSCAHPNLISSGHACAKPMQHGSGVSTFPGTRNGRT
ncbi:hypothetical protein CRG98_014419 [Punica granatum]|uniref:Uncharacterized protein n=1 Tax=Punica granatum TaxID=22663 RepID=A0A2I0K9G0_PUNGR|nr:hypothetical protein CRG98_014419 [Punica granatum]